MSLHLLLSKAEEYIVLLAGMRLVTKYPAEVLAGVGTGMYLNRSWSSSLSKCHRAIRRQNLLDVALNKSICC